jgi:hypothetical protein
MRRSVGFPSKQGAIHPSLCSMMQISIRPLKVDLPRFIILENTTRLPYLGVLGAILCKFRATGQTCVCANRIYVQSNVYAEFASRLAERVATFKPGNGLEEGT